MLKSALFFAAVVVATGLKSDQPPKDGPAPDKMHGDRAGDARDDNSLKMKMIWCPAGVFTPEDHTGKEGRVELTEGFWLGKTEVTQAEWARIMRTRPWAAWPRVRYGDDVAATYVTWEDAERFCERLTIKERGTGQLPPDWEYTLPTEAQWEYACRAGTTTTFSFGDDDAQLQKYAWYSDKPQTTLPDAKEVAAFGQLRVGQKKPNPWGLYDMHGNVWEWCRDGYAEIQPVGRNPTTEQADTFRVIRGGSWWNGAHDCRSARRDKQQLDHGDYSLGFRVALIRTATPK